MPDSHVSVNQVQLKISVQQASKPSHGPIVSLAKTILPSEFSYNGINFGLLVNTFRIVTVSDHI